MVSSNLRPGEYGPELPPESRDTLPHIQSIEKNRFDIAGGISRLFGLKTAETHPTTDEARALMAEGKELVQQLGTLDPKSNEFALALHHATSALSLGGLQVDPLAVEAYYDRALDYAEAKPYESDTVIRNIRQLSQSSRVQLNDKQNERAARVAIEGRDRFAAEGFTSKIGDIVVKSQLQPAVSETPYKRSRKNRVHKLRGKRETSAIKPATPLGWGPVFLFCETMPV